MRSPVPSRPRARDCEWLGGRYPLPNKVREGGEVIRPDVVLWLELPRGVIVSVKIIDPRAPVAFEETLAEAVKNRAEGSARRPARIRVANRRLADALKGTAGSGATVVVAPVPELDAVFADLTASIAGSQPVATYLADGTIAPGVVADLFSAASRFFRAAPWRYMSDQQIVRVDIPALQVEETCLSVIGAAGESFGFLLFRSVEAYESFVSSPAESGIEEIPRAGLLSLSFDRKKDLPPGMVREIKTHGWEVAGQRGHPVVILLDESGVPQEPSEHDYRVLTAYAQAFAPFFAEDREVYDQEEPERVRWSLTGDDGVTVTITAPYEAF